MYQSASQFLLLSSLCLAVSLLGGPVWCVITADNPGIRTVFTNKGLDYFSQVLGIPCLKSQLSSISIPDLSGSIIGKIEYKLSNIHLDSLDIPTSLLSTSAGKGLTLQASGISVKVSANWSYKLKSIKDHGTVDASGSGTSLSISVLVGADCQGHFNLSSTDCSFNVGSLKVKFHGGASWLYNLFGGTIASKVKDALNKQVCSAVTKAINNAGNEALKSLPVTVDIDGVSQIDYSLIQAPIFTSSYVQSDIKGEIQSVSDPEEYPFAPSPLPPASGHDYSDKMMYVWMTDYVANSAAVVYQKAGLMSYTITDDMIPEKSLFHLNTQCLSLFIPELQKKYPNVKLKAVARAAKPPTVNIKPHGANFTLPANVDVYVLDTATNSTPLAFTIGVLGDMVVTPYLTSENGNEYIKGKALALQYVAHVLM